MQTVLVLIVLTLGSLWYSGRRTPRQPTRAGEALLTPRLYGAILLLTLILVLLWR
jgi:hypothetical protein